MTSAESMFIEAMKSVPEVRAVHVSRGTRIPTYTVLVDGDRTDGLWARLHALCETYPSEPKAELPVTDEDRQKGYGPTLVGPKVAFLFGRTLATMDDTRCKQVYFNPRNDKGEAVIHCSCGKGITAKTPGLAQEIFRQHTETK